MNKVKTAAILIGGEGTRLRPLTINKPKALVPVAGNPLLSHILLWLKKYGIKEVVFILYYQKEKLKKVFGDGSRLGITIKYVEEDIPRGTGGALRKASKFLKNTTVVINGDVLTNINISNVINFHKERKAEITITLIPVEDPTSYGLVDLDKESMVTKFLEKPSWEEITQNKDINAGIYIIEPHIIERIPEDKVHSLERDLFPSLLKEKIKFYGYHDSQQSQEIYWIDVGTPEKYRQANHDILEGRFKVPIPYKKLREKVWIGNNKNISESSIIKKPVIIGNKCFIESDAILEEFTIIGNCCKIGKGSYIERSILWDNVEIGEGTKLVDCIIADNCNVGKFAKIGNGTVLGYKTKIPPYSIL